MKKRSKIIALLLVMVFMVLSINTVSAEAKGKELTAGQILKRSVATSSKIKSFTMTQDVSMIMKLDGKVYKQSTVDKVQYNKNPLRVKRVSTFKSNGEKDQSVDYYVKKGNKIHNYAKTEDGDYTKIKSHGVKEKDLNTLNPAKQLKEYMKYFENTKIKKRQVKIFGRNAYVITSQMDMRKMLEISKDGNSQDMQNAKGQKVKVTYWIDKKTYYPLKCSIDLTEVYNKLFESYPSLEMKISKCDITINYTKINKTGKVKLPSN